VEAQMQRHELGHRLHLLGAEPERRQPLADQLRAHHVVVMEGDLAALLEPPGGRLAHVVQQRGETAHQVGP